MKPYETYINTPENWYAKLPVSWKSKKLKEIFFERRTTVSDRDYPALSVGKMGVVPQLKTAVKTNSGDNRKLICCGDFAINSRSDRKGACGISKYTGSCSLVIIVLCPCHRLNNRFFHYLLRSHLFSEEFYRNGFGIVSDLWSTKWKNMRNISIPVPPHHEQDQIVRFLDWKISSINKIVSIKKKLLTTLEEQEKVFINNTILHGLDNSPLRDSGNSLIGKIPVTWDIIHLGKFCSFQNGISQSGNFFTSGTPFVAYGDVYRHMELPKTVLGRAQSTEQQQEIFSVRKGDIFFTRTSENIEEVGMAAICKHTIEKAVFSGFVIRCRPRAPLVDIDYMKYYLQIPAIRNHFSSMMNIVIRASLSQNRLKQMPVVIPPMDEQKAIAAYLDGRHVKYTCFAETVQKEIFLLNELKKRLISDVVTGKIDVRHIEIPHFDDVPDDTDAYCDDAAEAVAEEE